MTRIAEAYPPAHARYLVKRDGVLFTATPCYGMHAPWWVVKTMEGEAEPVDIRPTDEWARQTEAEVSEKRLWEVLRAHGKLVAALIKIRQGREGAAQIAADALAVDIQAIRMPDSVAVENTRLREYARHKQTCDVVTQPHPHYNPCNCGLDALLSGAG